MFKAKINAKKFQDIVYFANVLMDESKAKIDDEGLHIKGIDAAQVSMIIVDAKKSAFDFYESDSHELGLNLDKINRIIEDADKESLIEMELDEDKHKLKLKVGMASYTVSLLSPGSIKNCPNVKLDDELECDVSIKSEQFDTGIKAGIKIADIIAFECVEGFFVMSCEGDTDSFRYAIDRTNIIAMGEETGKSLYALEYLEDIAKAVKRSDAVRLRFKTDCPCSISFTTDEKRISAEYIIAPRVESKG